MTPQMKPPVLLPLMGEGYTGDRELLGYFPDMAAAAAFCAGQEWSEAWCAVLIRADGVEVCYDTGGVWVVI